MAPARPSNFVVIPALSPQLLGVVFVTQSPLSQRTSTWEKPIRSNHTQTCHMSLCRAGPGCDSHVSFAIQSNFPPEVRACMQGYKWHCCSWLLLPETPSSATSSTVDCYRWRNPVHTFLAGHWETGAWVSVLIWVMSWGVPLL